jgi:hypothetical protein
VKIQPDAGVPPSAALSTENVMYREIWLALMVMVPTVFVLVESTKRWPKPCTSSSRLHALPGAIA